MSTGILDQAMGYLANNRTDIVFGTYKSVSVPANTYTKVTSAELTAGQWIVISFLDFVTPASSIYIHMLSPTSPPSSGWVATRNSLDGGGGNLCYLYLNVTTTQSVYLYAYNPIANTARGQFVAIRIKDAVTS